MSANQPHTNTRRYGERNDDADDERNPSHTHAHAWPNFPSPAPNTHTERAIHLLVLARQPFPRLFQPVHRRVVQPDQNAKHRVEIAHFLTELGQLMDG